MATADQTQRTETPTDQASGAIAVTPVAVSPVKVQNNAHGYGRHGASSNKTRLRGWFAPQGSPDRDATDNLPSLRNRSRDLVYGTPLAKGAIGRLVDNVVGTGLRLNSQIDHVALGIEPEAARQWEADTEREWLLWAASKDSDAGRTLTFAGTQRQAFMSQLVNGDVFVMMPMIERPRQPYQTRTYLIEGDRVANPPQIPEILIDVAEGNTTRGGVEIDSFGAPVAYWISKTHPETGGFTVVRRENWSRVEAYGADTGRRNVLHLFQPDRPEQRRGVPVLSTVMELFKQLDRYIKAEVDAAVVAGYFAVFVTSDLQENALGEGIAEDERAFDSGSAEDNTTIEIAPGGVVDLAPGQKIETSNPGRPNSGFDPFVTSLLRQLGSALGIPFELLVLHFTSSYSASRAALLEFRRSVMIWRAWLATNLCQPIYEEWLAEAVALGRVVAPGFSSDPARRAAWSRAEWPGQSAGQVDPVKEVTASKMLVEEGFSTRKAETAKLTGMDYDAVTAQRIAEEEQRREGVLTGSDVQTVEIVREKDDE